MDLSKELGLAWPHAQEVLRARIPSEEYDAWIAPLRFLRCDQETLVLRAPDGPTASTAEYVYGQEIERAWTQCNGLLWSSTVFIEVAGTELNRAPAPSFPTWNEYLKTVRTTFLNCLNARLKVARRMKPYECRQVKSLYDQHIPLKTVKMGILRAFEYAIQNNKPITSFGYCIRQIDVVMRERKF